jgi:hypothetical protein
MAVEAKAAGGLAIDSVSRILQKHGKPEVGVEA